MQTVIPESQKRACVHKRVYQTRAEARRVAKLTQRSNGERRHRCRVYECDFCGYWHLTSRPKKQETAHAR